MITELFELLFPFLRSRKPEGRYTEMLEFRVSLIGNTVMLSRKDLETHLRVAHTMVTDALKDIERRLEKLQDKGSYLSPEEVYLELRHVISILSQVKMSSSLLEEIREYLEEYLDDFGEMEVQTEKFDGRVAQG